LYRLALSSWGHNGKNAHPPVTGRAAVRHRSRIYLKEGSAFRSIFSFMVVMGMMFGSISMASAATTGLDGSGTELVDGNRVLETVECYPEFLEAQEGAYIHWVLTPNSGATQADLHINGQLQGTMFTMSGQPKGTLHFFSGWFELNSLSTYAGHN
jgi:hypothetical protein